MSITVLAHHVISFIPKGIQRVTSKTYIRFEPKGVVRIKSVSSFGRFILVPQEQTAEAGTERNVFFIAMPLAGTFRGIKKTETAAATAIRFVQDLSGPITVEVPAFREVASTNQTLAEVQRNLYAVQKVTVGAVICSAITAATSASFQRTVYQTAVIPADTARKIPYILRPTADMPLAVYGKKGIQSVSITLSERTLSDVFQMVTTQPVNIEDSIMGKLLDYPYRFLVEETSQQNLTQSVKGMYDVDAILYTPFHFTKWEPDPEGLPEDPEELAELLNSGGECSRYIGEIAKALGLKLSSNYEDYRMSQNYSDSGMTYHDLIAALFGWTTRLPQRQINVFIRNDTLCVIQRGMEKTVLDITGWPHTRPAVSRKLIRSIWNNRTENDYNPKRKARSDDEDTQVPFSGTIGVGKVFLRYSNGYLVYETNNGDETVYQYDGEYLSSKRSSRQDGTTIETEYTYYRTEKDIYLMKEEEVVYSEAESTQGEQIISTRVTNHAPIGGGWYLTSVYTDDNFEGSTLSQGPPGAKASQYMVDAMNRHLGRDVGTPEAPFLLKGISLIDTSFPVKGEVFLRKLTKALEWLNRKTQEEVSLEIVANVRNGVPDVTHIVDFTERIKLDGNEYFLVSNNIELTPRSLRQKLRMVRWY